MIKSIRLQNFFGFQDCTINLEKGENVLVGINGSGKSNFFKAIRVLKAAYNRNLRSIFLKEFKGLHNILHNQAGVETNSEICITYTFSIGERYLPHISEVHYELKVIATNKHDNEYYVLERIWSDENGTITEFLVRDKANTKFRFNKDHDLSLPEQINFPDTESVLGWRQDGEVILDIVYQINANHVYVGFNTSEIRKGEVLNTADKVLLEDASNLISLYERFEKSTNELEISAYNFITEALRKVNNKYEQLTTKRRLGEIELWLKEENLLEESALNISDGTLRFLYLLIILYNPYMGLYDPKRGGVICIDEPELGLHPDMLFSLGEAVKFAAQTNQVIISTHSPILLDFFELEDIIVFEKNEENATIVKKFTEKDFEGWYDKILPGEMWQAGDLGGNRW